MTEVKYPDWYNKLTDKSKQSEEQAKTTEPKQRQEQQPHP